MTRNNLCIISISLETSIGGLIKNGDKIHLINQYETKSYLDTNGGYNGKYRVQTSTSPNRHSGSGTWEIVMEGCINNGVEYEKGKISENRLYFVYHFLVSCDGLVQGIMNLRTVFYVPLMLCKVGRISLYKVKIAFMGI